MKRVGIVTTALLLFVLLGASALGYAQQEQQSERKAEPDTQTELEKQKGKQQDQKKEAKQQQQEQKRQVQEQDQQQQQADENRQQQQRARQQAVENRQQQQRAQQQVDQNEQAHRRQQDQQQQQARLSQQRQQQLIQEQQQRMTQYRQHLDQQQAQAQRQTAELQQQKRMAQYRFQEQYSEGLRRQQVRVRDDRNHDYDRDAYFYTAPTYRYQRGGRYYETNEYGANVLRQAVNSGYDQGFRAGQADRQDRWRSSYQDSYAYQDANYGYNGYYVAQDDYNFYFREGFRRGYEDGYNRRDQYGRYSNGSYSILDVILGQVLGFEPLDGDDRGYGRGPVWGRGPQPDQGACFFSDTEFRGDYFCVSRGESLRALPSGFNDRISSIRVLGGSRVTVFRDDDFRGDGARLNRDTADLRDLRTRDYGRNWNDRISSIQVD